MKIYYECGACFLRQAREAMDLATDVNSLKIELMEDIFQYLSNNYKIGASSNKLGSNIHRMIKEKTHCFDPYIKEKAFGNQIANKLLPKVKEILDNNDNLENYVKIAIIGNILDFGALGLDTNLEEMIFKSLNKELAINDIEELDKSLKNTNSVLYLADNTGEIVFDKLLIQKLRKKYNIDVTLAVKEKPILNDACVEDAIAIDLDKITNLVTIGTDSVGIVYEDLSREFKDIFNNHDLIISKGLGNYEGLTEINTNDKDVFCLLSAKCSAIAKDVGVRENDNVIVKIS